MPSYSLEPIYGALRFWELVSDLNKSLCGKKCILTFEIVALVCLMVFVYLY